MPPRFTAELLVADFKTEPYVHQLREFEESCGLQTRALLWCPRAGKTKHIVDVACHLYIAGEIDAVLLLAPNGIHENWTRRELPKHHWDAVPRDTLVWRTDLAGEKGKGRVRAHERKGWQEQHDAFWDRAKRMMKSDRLCWFSFNTESMTRRDVRNLMARVLRNRRCMAVFDEADDFRSPGSTRTKMARAIKRKCPYRRIATASVVTNSPLQAFSEFELLDDAALGFERYEDFEDRFAEYKKKRNRQGRTYIKLDRYKNLDELRELMAPYSSVVLREDIPDMPPLVNETRHVELTDNQVRLYRELHSRFTVELEEKGKEVSIGENSSKIAKFQQIVSGFLIDEYGDLHEVPGGNPRLDALSDEVYLAPGKVIVWCRFRHDIDLAARRLQADGHDLVQYHGRIGPEDKQTALDRFRDDPNVKVMLGQPQAGGRGYNMAAADQVIWYSHMLGHAIVREQADERASEIGGGNVLVTDFVAKGVDEYAMDLFASKFAVADDLAREGMRDVLRRIRI